MLIFKKSLLILFLLTTEAITFADVEYDSCAQNRQRFDRCTRRLFFNSESKRCGRALIGDYSVKLFGPLNRHLRGIKFDPSCEEIAPLLISAVTRIKSEQPILLFRGTYSFPELKNLKEGQCFVDRAFMSTTTNRHTAENFSNENDGIIMEIEATSAKNVSNYANYKEEEYLLLPKTYLKLIERNEQLHKTILKFDEVSVNQCPSDQQK